MSQIPFTFNHCNSEPKAILLREGTDAPANTFQISSNWSGNPCPPTCKPETQNNSQGKNTTCHATDGHQKVCE